MAFTTYSDSFAALTDVIFKTFTGHFTTATTFVLASVCTKVSRAYAIDALRLEFFVKFYFF